MDSPKPPPFTKKRFPFHYGDVRVGIDDINLKEVIVEGPAEFRFKKTWGFSNGDVAYAAHVESPTYGDAIQHFGDALEATGELATIYFASATIGEKEDGRTIVYLNGEF